MSSEIFEKNVGEMLRRAALRPDEARARERFLRDVEAPEERRSWKFAAAAAAILVAVTIVWSARSERPVDGVSGQSTTKPPPQEYWSGHSCPATGADDLLWGGFTLRGRLRPPQVLFEGRAEKFPDGLHLHVRVHRLSEKFQDGRLVSYDRESEAGVVTFQKGEVQYPWEYKGPERVAVEAFVNDALQEQDVAKALKGSTAKRSWTFEGSIWNRDVVWRLESQHPEALEILHELRMALRAAKDACSAGRENFKRLDEVLTHKLGQIESRARAFGKKSLFPASMGVVEYAARDLSVQVSIFTWEKEEFTGPKSYHTNNQLAKTFRGDPFSFDAYQRYLDEAAVVAGREFLLWIVRDATVSSLGEEQRKLLRDRSLKPGVEDFAQRLLRLNSVGNDPTLEAEIRVLKK